MRSYVNALVALAVLGTAACGGTDGERPTEARTLGRPAQEVQPVAQTPAAEELPPTPLVAEVASRDLGTVGIRDGRVETTFRVRNSADEPTVLAAVYTSCMCTEATLEFGDGTTVGPFGMPGHELPVTLERTVAAGEAFDVRARFDPLAHGPGVTGPMQRGVAVHSGNGGMLQLDFTVNVVEEVASAVP